MPSKEKPTQGVAAEPVPEEFLPTLRVPEPGGRLQGEAGTDAGISRSLGTGTCEALNSLPEFVHQYLRDFIVLADQKAGVIFTVASALVGYLFSQKVTGPLHNPSTLTVAGVLGLGGALCLVASAVCALLVVIPRLRTGVESGVVFWEEIGQFPTAAAYAGKVAGLTAGDAGDALSRHCYALAGICQKKYRMLTRSLWAGGLGFVMAIAHLLMAQTVSAGT
jgi:hypothetical protein